MNLRETFIIIGIVFIILGVIGTSLGKLPGDFSFKKGNLTVYFPLMTSIIVSIILTLIFIVIQKFR